MAFRAMGTHVVLVAHGVGAPVLSAARDLVRRCERRWSRFLPDSELSRLNAAAGRPTVLTDETYALVAGAVGGWSATAGRFDPTVLAAVRAAGYDRPFDDLGAVVTTSWAPVPGCGDIELDDGLRAVTLPPGVGLDLGGIAKGHTADLVVEHLLDAGATGALADLGGDIRAVGDWNVAVEAEDGDVQAVLGLADGAVVTSSTRRRRWRGAGGTDRHHLIDPTTGAPAATGLVQATVVARTASTAEVLATAAVVAGRRAGAEIVLAAGATGILVDDWGVAQHLPGLEQVLA